MFARHAILNGDLMPQTTAYRAPKIIAMIAFLQRPVTTEAATGESRMSLEPAQPAPIATQLARRVMADLDPHNTIV